MPEGYCMKCKTKRTMTNFEAKVTRKKKVHQTKGVSYIAERVMGFGECPVCHTKIARAYGKPPAGVKLTDDELRERLKAGEPGHTFTIGVCPSCNESKQIPMDDYVCLACRKEMSN